MKQLLCICVFLCVSTSAFADNPYDGLLALQEKRREEQVHGNIDYLNRMNRENEALEMERRRNVLVPPERHQLEIIQRDYSNSGTDIFGNKIAPANETFLESLDRKYGN